MDGMDDPRERRLRVMEKNAARRFIRELRLARGTPLAKAVPAICAHFDIPLDRDALEALGLLH